MGADPLTMAAMQTAATVGSKMLAGGQAQAAPAAGGVNPMTAGLIGMGPPMPEKNPAFHEDQPGGLAGPSAVVKNQPELQGLFDKLDKAKPQPPTDSVGSFDSRPYSQETVYGQPASTAVEAVAARAPAVSPRDLPTTPVPPEEIVADDAPFRAATAEARPVSGMSPAFDASPASTPGAAATPQPAGGMFDGFNAWVKGMPTNPMGQIGLSLLASGYDGSNPYSGIQTGLGNIPRLELALQSGRIAQAAADRAEKGEARSEADRAREDELTQLIAAMAAKYSEPEYEGGSRVARSAAKVIK